MQALEFVVCCAACDTVGELSPFVSSRAGLPTRTVAIDVLASGRVPRMIILIIAGRELRRAKDLACYFYLF